LDVVKLGESLDSKEVEEGHVGEKLESCKEVLSNVYLLKLKKQGEEEAQVEPEVVLPLFAEVCRKFCTSLTLPSA